jgi:ABC-type transport system involved in multi-copper enzyme maturation permease subunit
MSSLAGILTIAHLTWLEARRRRIVLAAVVCGLIFLLIFGVAHYFMRPPSLSGPNAVLARLQLQGMTLAGLYVVNFLLAAFAVMLPVDSLSGEISSGVMQTLAAKPIRRLDILLGKWLVYWLMLAGYMLLNVLGLVAEMWVITGFSQRNLLPALGLMQLEASVLLSITIAGGVRFSTVTNGIVAFGFYAVAFIGGWIEQIGVVLGNAPSRYIGTAISLISPSDALSRLTMHVLQPGISNMQISPFGSASVPSDAMVWWSMAYVVVALAMANRGFKRRAL